jgi:hypothetical protein
MYPISNNMHVSSGDENDEIDAQDDEQEDVSNLDRNGRDVSDEEDNENEIEEEKDEETVENEDEEEEKDEDADKKEDALVELSLKELLALANKGEFPKKLFKFGNTTKYYTQRLHFFTSKRVFKGQPSKAIAFKCKCCGLTRRAKFPLFTNLSHHLQDTQHVAWVTWLTKFNKVNHIEPKIIDDHTLKVIRFLISNNTSMQQIDSDEFIDLVNESNKIACSKTFKRTLLPETMKQLTRIINIKLEDAESICLVVDLWSSTQNVSFLAVVAVLMDENL